MKKFLHFLGTLWCLPATILVWLFYILPMWLIWKDFIFMGWGEPFIADFQLANRDVEPWHARAWKDWYGVGLPNAAIHRNELGIFDDQYVELVKVHERRHCVQWFWLGIFFYPVYLVAGWIQGMRGKDRYLDNPFEVDARKASGEE